MTARRRGALTVTVAAAVLAVPLLVALVVLHSPRWYPLGDLAQTELRVRDVWSAHPPLVGLPGRIGKFPNQGSHPGPLSFYALWPFWRLLGASSFGLQVASTVVQFGAMVVALWIAWRRAGTAMVIAVGALLAVLAHNVGTQILIEPWNPYLPVMAWVPFVLAVWSVCCDDIAMLPIVAVFGSYCMQTHVSYVAPVGGLGLVAIVATVLYARRVWSDLAARTRALRWSVIAVVLGALVWVAPVVDQLTGKDRNLGALWDYFRNPPTAAIGVHRGLELLLAHLNPWSLLAGRHNVSGSTIGGTVYLVVWALTAVWAARGAPMALRRLHLVLAFALVLELVAISRIFGDVFFYLMLWSLAITGLMAIAIGWTIATTGVTTTRVATATAAAVMLVFTGWFTFNAAYAQMSLAKFGYALGGVLPRTITALHADERARGGHARYLVTWFDPVDLGGRGFAFLNELERAGFDVGAPSAYHVAVTDHRVVDPELAAAQLHLAIGNDIDVWRAKPGAREIAGYDPRSPAERAESARLHALVVRDLRARGLDAEIGNLDGNIYAVYADPRVPAATKRMILRIGNLDLPEAVFIAPGTA